MTSRFPAASASRLRNAWYLTTLKDELLPVQGGAEGTEVRVLALHTEVREKCEVTSERKDMTSNLGVDGVAFQEKAGYMGR